MPGEEFGDGVVHQRGEGLLPGLVTADHGVFAWHHHASELHGPAAAGEKRQWHGCEPAEQEGAPIQLIREAHAAAPFA